MVQSRSVASQYSWRLRDRRGERVRARRVRLTVAILILLALLATLVWFFYWRWDAHYTYFGSLAAGYHPAVVPRMAFQDEDIQQLNGLLDDPHRKIGWRDLQIGGQSSIDGVVQQIKACGAGRRDAVIVYLSMHGISYQGAAYLAQSEFFRPEQTTDTNFAKGLDKLSGLLKSLSASNAGLILVVLDAGRIGYDPRLGVLTNGFPELAEQAVAELQNDRLWVLLSHGPGQVSGSDSGARMSLFAEHVVAALRGGADFNRNKSISLTEFYTYVWNGVTTWKAAGRSVQTPLLLHGGTGSVTHTETETCTVILADVAPPATPPEDGTSHESKHASPRPEEEQRQSLRWDVRGSPHVAMAMPSWGQDAGSSPIVSRPANDAKPVTRPAADTTAKANPTQSEQAGSPTAPASTPSEPDQTDPATVASDEPSVVSGPGSPKPESPPAITEMSPIEMACANLDEAWRLRDKLSGPEMVWSPADFAPVEWRQVESLLLDSEARVRMGIIPEGLATLRDDLRNLSQEVVNPDDQRSYSEPVKAIAAAWRRFHLSQRRVELDRTELQSIKSAWRLCCHALQELPYYVRWQAHKVVLLNQTTISESDANDVGYCLDRVHELVNKIKLAQTNLTPNGAAEIQDISGRLQRSLNVLHDRLSGEIQGIGNGADPERDRRVDCLLATPLLSAGQRAEVLRKSLDRKPHSELAGLDRTPDDSANRPANTWSAIAIVVDWELKLWQLYGAALPQEVLENWNSRQTKTDIDLADLGEAMRKGFPKQASRPRTSSEEFSLLAWLLDPRDPREASDRQHQVVALPNVRVPIPTASLNIAETQDEITLDWNAETRMPVRIEAQGLVDSMVEIDVEFDTPLLSILPAAGQPAIDKRTPLQWTITSGEPQFVYVKALGTAPAAERRVVVTLTARAHQASDNSAIESAPRQVICLLPLPFDVDVWTRVGSESVESKPEYATGTDLHPYPNRKTPIQILLANRSERARKVRVDLFAIPKQPAATNVTSDAESNWAPGRIFVEGRLRPLVSRLVFKVVETHEIVAEATPLAETELTLSREPGERTLAEFKPPGSLRAAANPPTESASASGPAAPQPTPVPNAENVPDPNISEGMVLVVTNTTDPTERVVKWLGIRPQHPREYVGVKKISRDENKLRLEFGLQNQATIPGIADKPVVVDWVNFNELALTNHVAQVNLRADLQRPEDTTILADFSHAMPSFRMDFTVDNYPRAFSYKISEYSDEQPVDQWDLRNDIRIVSVKPVYEPPPNSVETGAQPPAATAIHVSPSIGNGPSALVIPASVGWKCIGLETQLEVDAPANSFEGRSPAATISFNGRALYFDRNVASHLAGLEDGALHVLTNVTDFQIPENVQKRSPIPLVAELKRSQQEAQQSQVMVIIDEAAPQITAVRFASLTVPENRSISFDVECQDGQSGITQLITAIDLDDSGTIDETDIRDPSAEAVASPMTTESMRLTRSLPTAKIPPPLNPDGYYVVTQVKDGAGNVSAVVKSSERFRIIRPVPAMEKKLTKGTIRGTLMLPNGVVEQIDNVSVKIVGRGESAIIDGMTFRFDDIPNGTYTLEATGSFQNTPRKGTAGGAKPKDPKKATVNDVPISMERVRN